MYAAVYGHERQPTTGVRLFDDLGKEHTSLAGLATHSTVIVSGGEGV